MIEAGGPNDEMEAPPCLGCDVRIPDLDLRNDLYDRLVMDLEAFELEKIVSGAFEMARLMTFETLADIEAASRSN